MRPLTPRPRLNQARRKAYPHLTVEQFAQRLGITKLHVIAVEKGRRDPRLDLMRRWVRLLGKHGSMDLFAPEPPERRPAA